MKILRVSDIVTFKQDDLEIDVSPMTYQMSMEYDQMVTVNGGEIKSDNLKRAEFLIKNCVKEIRGVQDMDGKDIELKSPFNESSLSDVMTTLSRTKLAPHLSSVAYFSTLPGNEVDYMVNGKKVNLGKSKKQS